MTHLVRVRLADPSHRMRFPGTARWFGAPGSADGVHDGVETVDRREVFWIACLRDGSIIEASPEADPAAAASDAPRREVFWLAPAAAAAAE